MRIVQAVSSRGRCTQHEPGEARRSARCRGAPSRAMSVISSTREPDAGRPRARASARSAPAAAGSAAGSRRSGRTLARIRAVSRGKRIRATSGNEASTPTAAGQHAPRRRSDRLPTWNWCDAVPSARRVRARRRCASSWLVDHLLGDPVLRAGSRPGRAGRSGRRPPPGSTSRREEPGRAERLDVGGQLLQVAAERLLALVEAEDRLEPRLRRRPAPAAGACSAMASSVWVQNRRS